MADFNSKYSGEQVEALLDIVAEGISGGGGEGEVQKTTEAEIAAMGFTKNEGTITEVKMNGVSKGSNGIVDLGTVITEHQNIAGIEGEITAIKLAQRLSLPSEDNPNPLATAQDLESKTDIIASQIFLELHTDLDDFQVFSHKRGYGEHNRKVCQRLIENCFTDKMPNNEVFFVTINGSRNRVPYMETAILESSAGEVVRASFVKGNGTQSSSIAASIDVLSIDAEALRSYAESGEDIFYWRYISTIVPSIDAIGSEGESDVYVTEFTFEEITSNNRAVNVSPELVSAIYNKRIIVIPSSKAGNYIATNVFSDAPFKNVSIQMQIVSGTFVYDVTLSGEGAAPQTVPTRVSEIRLLSGTLNTINGASLTGGMNMPLVSSISINGKTYTPSKGAVDLGEIKVDEVKFANDLTGVVEATPEMFTYRPSAGDKSVRDESAVIRRIKGNTSVWGQIISGLVNDGTTKIEKEGDAWIITPITNTSSPGSVNWGSGWATFNNQHSLNTNHIYLCCVTFTKISKRTNLEDFVVGRTLLSMRGKYIYLDADLGQRTTAVLISKPGASGEIFLSLNDCVTKIENPMLFDLTDIFGAGNEPTTYEEFREYYPDAYYPYCALEVRSMRATGIETIGFNAFNGEYAEVIGGQPYYLGGAIDTAHFATEVGGESLEVTIPENRLYTPSENGYIYATGSDICINITHSGVRNGEYKPYEKNTLLLPEIAKYFPDGMHGIGDVTDEINDDFAIQRCATRAYESGDESNAEVMTDNVTTVYKLAEPIYTPIDEPMQLDYKVDDFGTERALAPEDSSPFKADIVYQFNAEGRIRDNSRNIEKLEKLVKQPSDWLEDNPNSPAYIANKPTMPTQVATATEVIAVYGIPTQMLPNVVYEVRVSIDTNFTFPQLVAGEENVSNVWKLIAYMLQGTVIAYPSTIKWRDGIPPTIDAAAFVEFTFTSITGRTEILGEWKLYK